MKKLYAFTIIIIFFLSSCSKSNNNPPAKKDTTATVADTTKVTIKNVVYPVVTIGKQRWTAINYAGPGGYDLTPAGSVADWGRLYSRATAMAVVLPSGWRLPTSQDYSTLISSTIKNSQSADPTYRIYSEILGTPTGWLYFTGHGQFNAYPYGDAQILTGSIFLEEYMGYIATYWTSTTSSANNTTYYNWFQITTSPDPSQYPDELGIGTRVPADTIYHLPVRFIKDVN